MASKRNSASISKDAIGDGANGEDSALGTKRRKRSSLTLPVTVPLTERTADHKPSESYRQEKSRLLELPLDLLCLVADHLDVVDRACLGYAYPAPGGFSEEDLCNFSACARSRIVSLLLRDGVSIPKELLEMTRKGTTSGQCSEYQNFVPKYCVICRCHGHLSHCPKCGIRTCAREGKYILELIRRNLKILLPNPVSQFLPYNEQC